MSEHAGGSRAGHRDFQEASHAAVCTPVLLPDLHRGQGQRTQNARPHVQERAGVHAVVLGNPGQLHTDKHRLFLVEAEVLCTALNCIGISLHCTALYCTALPCCAVCTSSLHEVAVKYFAA